jgi:hypothetical protein
MLAPGGLWAKSDQCPRTSARGSPHFYQSQFRASNQLWFKVGRQLPNRLWSTTVSSDPRFRLWSTKVSFEHQPDFGLPKPGSQSRTQQEPVGDPFARLTVHNAPRAVAAGSCARLSKSAGSCCNGPRSLLATQVLRESSRELSLSDVPRAPPAKMFVQESLPARRVYGSIEFAPTAGGAREWKWVFLHISPALDSWREGGCWKLKVGAGLGRGTA